MYNTNGFLFHQEYVSKTCSLRLEIFIVLQSNKPIPAGVEQHKEKFRAEKIHWGRW